MDGVQVWAGEVRSFAPLKMTAHGNDAGSRSKGRESLLRLF